MLIPAVTRSHMEPMQLSSQEWSTITPTKRAYNDAFMHACHAEGWSEPEKTRVLSVLGEAYELNPISLVYDEGIETNALVQRELLPKAERQYSVSSVALPIKRPDSPESAVMLEASLYATITAGPYGHKLLAQQFTELNDEICQMLNSDWLDKPSLRYACSRLLAAMVLLVGTTGTTIVANTIEVYDRERDVDSHHESYKSSRSTRSSIPPATTRYLNVWPMTIVDSDGRS
ncbi:hypothetical protein BC940DRAFT_299716 [Gongronella butleri]|nr:hypothetical protein BC940DRAFT_299716 [Gongronella butleri]